MTYRNYVSTLDADLLSRDAQHALKLLVASYDPTTNSFIGLGGGNMLGYSTGPQEKDDSNTTESGALFTLNIPANTLGPNSVLMIITRWSFTDTSATWNLRTRFGGAVPDNVQITGNTSLIRHFESTNRNSRAVQDLNPINAASIGTFSTSALTTGAVDFATVQQLTITAQANAAGTGSKKAKLVNARVLHWFGA